MIYSIVQSMRPREWIKNLFVFIPILISGSFFNLILFRESFIAFISFCLVSSCVYFFNDIIDIERDRMHNVKKNRPIASGKISLTTAYVFIFIMLAVILLIQNFSNYSIYLIIGLYILININYSLWLKRIPILDVICISSGFVFRVLAGVVATGLETSSWLISMTFTLAMLLALGKRKAELKKSQFVNTRDSLKGYSEFSIINMQNVFISCTLVFYLLYINLNDSFSGNKYFLYVSSIFVIAGLLRYIQISSQDVVDEQPTNILYNDKFIMLSVISWGLTIALSFLFS